jgi:membrane-associated protease RseP (regulator of RpoE activity)
METEKKMYTIVVVVALVGLVFSCVAGALAGGVAGFFVGQRQGRIAAERALSGGLGVMPRVEEVPGSGQGQEPVPFPGPRAVPSSVEGALVVNVVSDTPADQAGLQVGDVIVAVDRTPVNGNHPLPDVIGQYQPGDRVTIHFWRGDGEQSVTVKLAAHPDDASKAYLGVYFEMQDTSRPQD